MEALELIKMAIPLIAIGGAYGAAKVTINGTKERVSSVESEVRAIQHTVDDRLARVETKIDILLEKR